MVDDEIYDYYYHAASLDATINYYMEPILNKKHFIFFVEMSINHNIVI
ncbi:MAG: hypothetical protein ACI4A3_07285 [Lachnospiraceae bacterium]